MLKLLLTVVVVVLGLMFWFGKGRARPAAGGRAKTAPPPGAPQAMVACAHCGLHLPRAEVFLNDRGEPFCGAEHRRLGPARGRR